MGPSVGGGALPGQTPLTGPSPVLAQEPSCPAAANPVADEGWAAYRAGDLQAAERSFREALERCPEHLSATTGLGYVALRAGRDAEARDRLLASLEIHADNVDALVGLGILAWRAGDLEAVARRFRRVRELDPDNPDAADYLARLPEGLGPPPERPPLALPDTLEYPSRAVGTYFEVRGEEGWEPFWVKGVNLGAALPGRHPSQFPDSAVYAEWLRQMGEMEANVVRVYTIHPPDFYEAFLDYNRSNPDRPLWLVHGVWTELPADDDFSGAAFEGEFFAEMERVVDLLHGRADIAPRPGHASGFYTADVSDRVLAYVIGREWEPFSVVAFDRLYPDLDAWRGDYVVVEGGNAMDVWLGRAVEEIVAYESETYREQRPVAYTNWPTLDPLDHRSEATVDEEVEIRESLGERVERVPLEYDNDVIAVDPSLLEPTAAFPAGTFASYHAYPYYPDFMILSEAYRDAASPWGPSNYFGYLRDLKAHHDDMPLLVAEYGVPTSVGSAHLQPQGWHHGGLSEAEMARIDQRLTLELAAAGTAGGILFAWIDEWFKKNWIVIEFEIPLERNRLWYNRLDAEQHYGMLAMEPPTPVEGETAAERVRGWEAVPALYEGADGTTLRATWDEANLWLQVRPGTEAGERWRVGFDLVDPAAGDVRWPGREGPPLPVGLEFVLEGDGRGLRLLVDPPVNPFVLDPVTGGETTAVGGRELDPRDPPPGFFTARAEMGFNRPYLPRANGDGVYDSLRVLTNRRRFTRDSVEWLAAGYDRGLLPAGDAPDGLWSHHAASGTWEVRIPWMLINFTDPSQRRLLHGPAEADDLPDAPFGTVLLDEIRLVLGVQRPDGGWENHPASGAAADVAAFTWPTWDEPRWRARRRPVFDVMAETFRTMDPWAPEGFELREPDGAGESDGTRTPSPEPASERPAPPVAPPDQEVPSAERADSAWRAGDTDRAAELYEARLEAFPEEPVALHRLALIRAWNERYEASLGLLDRLLEVQPDHLEARVDRARVLAWRGDVDEALAALDALLGDEPEHRPALEARARFQMWAGQLEASLDTYDRLLALSPQDRALRRQQALVLGQAERYERSLEVYDSLIAADPDDLEARLGRARILTWSGDTDAALAAYEAVLAREPDDAGALQGRARALTWGGRLRAGERAWRAAAAVAAPTDPDPWIGLTQNLRWQGRPAAALDALERAEAIDPVAPDAREQRRWIEATLAPQVEPSVLLERDTDDNRMLTTSVTAGWHPVPRLGLRATVWGRDLERRALEQRARGMEVQAAWQPGPGWRFAGEIGAAETDAEGPAGESALVLGAAVTSPGGWPVVGTLAVRRSPLYGTVRLAEVGVVVDEVSVSGRWSPAPAWQLTGSTGAAVFEGTEENERVRAAAALSRRFGRAWSAGLALRGFAFGENLEDGYFDPDFYGVLEAPGRWLWEPGPWSLTLEAAPGLQRIGREGDATGTLRSSARLAYRFRPGRELALSGGYSSTGLQSFATADADYAYTALIVGGSWTF